MKTKSLLSKVLAAALAVVMLVGLVPCSVQAYEGEGSYADGPVALKKTATLQGDGTYTIALEAFTTGTVTTIVEKQNAPTDIVLVIDQSGSMAEKMDGLPNNQYVEAGTLSNADAYSGTYYYKSGDAFYPVTVKYATVGDVEIYVDINGEKYTSDQASWKWTASNKKEFDAYGPYLTTSLVTLTREKRTYVNQYRYSTDNGPWTAWTGSYGNAYQARQAVREKYFDYTVQFDNDENTGYVAAAYKQLTPVYAHTYEYYYTDAEGNLVALPAIGSSNDSDCPYVLYTSGVQSGGKRLDVLKYAVKKFVDGVEADANANNIQHNIAIVGFSSDNYNNTEILTGVSITKSSPLNNSSTSYYPDGYAYNGVQYESSGYSSATKNALQNVGSEDGKKSIHDAINALTAHGGTYSHNGLQMAEDILNSREDKTREAVVVFFTDGEPGDNGFEDEYAAETIRVAKELKNGYECGAIEGRSAGAEIDYNKPLGYTANIYSVAVYEGASPTGTANIKGSGATRINEFLHMVSSNYKLARGENQNKRGWEFFREEGSMTAGYYMVANNAAALANIFTTITNNIHQSTATVDLGGDAVLRDVLNTGFVLPANYDQNQIRTQVSAYKGAGKWDTPVDFNAQVTISGSQIDITGFDYNNNFVSETQKDDGTYGAKIIVTIPGILATDQAATGTDVFTNTDRSGIWGNVEDELTLVKAFDRPTTSIANQLYVLDYAKETNLSYTNVFSTVSGLDDSSDRVFSKSDSWFSSNIINSTYGSFVKDSSSIKYVPKTTKWDGYDSIYVFGQNSLNENRWSKLSVLPANNVYYEDTFVTSETDGTVGIFYDQNWLKAGEGSNTEYANGSRQGFEESLRDDTGDSDGSLTTTGKLGATATFEFTGTGFDIYSRTNINSGKVYAKVSKLDENGAVTKNWGLVVDTVSVSGEYYSIPTLWFAGDYGTYRVTLKVQSNVAEGAAYSYCIDGIRIYNPLNPENMDKTVDDAYGEELNATFASVRDMLLDAGSLNSVVDNPETGEDETKNPKQPVNGCVFIDKQADGMVGGTTNVIGTYKDYGPKNEVYLAPGNAIAFYVGTDVEKLHVGLKAPVGGTATAKVSARGFTEGITVAHTTDLYYEVKPDANGFVVIQNAPESKVLLSVTKVKFFAGDGVAETTADALIAAVDRFDAMTVLPYTSKLTPGITDSDIVIENPGPAYGNPAIENSATELLRKLFSDFRGWFHP